MIIEAKHVDKLNFLESACNDAIRQIDDKKYAVEFAKGYRIVICYGIAFHDKECCVKKFDEIKKVN